LKGLRATVIEDEEDILDVIRYNLEREAMNITCFQNGEEALQATLQAPPDIILLDLMLPGIDGLELCRRFRSNPRTSATPIIMVTAKDQESDLVLGLGLGADDYISKPFSPRELVARVQAVLRRGNPAGPQEEGRRIEIENLIIDLDRHQVLVDGTPRAFTATELRLLFYLASNRGKALTRDQLLDRAVSPNTLVIDRNVDVHIGAIRRKLGSMRNYIQTIRGVGYRFEESPANQGT
jgi:DNA-binding response OmpR family regulator